MRGLFLFLLCGLLALAVRAQVPNNDIENRLQLLPEFPLVSATSGCTVQRECVDERLTGKCIQYHNDQWFYFVPGAGGEYFLNVGGQQCRDQRGVQLVVLQGEPCHPETYQVLRCTSLSTQDDIFVKLSLQAHQTYLLNVDGYLHDDCTFTLTLSNKPTGLPVSPPLNAAQHESTAAGLTHTTSWRIPDADLADNLQHFELWRRKNDAFRATEVGRTAAKANAFGVGGRYVLTDSVSEKGTYVYQLIGVKTNGEKVLLLGFEEELGKAALNRSTAQLLTLDFAYLKKTPLDILVYDAATGALLYKKHFVADKHFNTLKIDVSEAQKQGTTHFRVSEHNLRTNNRREWVVKL